MVFLSHSKNKTPGQALGSDCTLGGKQLLTEDDGE